MTRAWVLAARPKTLPAAAVPVLVGTAVASSTADIDATIFAATLAAALLIQIGTNFANDYSDFVSGADTAERLGPVRVTQGGLLAPHSVRWATYIAFSLALLVGFYLAYVGGWPIVLIGAGLAWIGGWPIILIGVLSVLAGLAYTGGPFPFGYHGLGDLFVFLFFGIVAVCGTAYLQAAAWSGYALLLSVPVGLLVTNILVVNNLRDLPTDRAASKRTLAVRIGDRATRVQYALFAAIAYLIPLVIAATQPSRRWLFLPLATLPLAVRLVRRVLAGVGGRDLNPMLKASGQLLLFFGVLLAVALLLARGV